MGSKPSGLNSVGGSVSAQSVPFHGARLSIRLMASVTASDRAHGKRCATVYTARIVLSGAGAQEAAHTHTHTHTRLQYTIQHRTNSECTLGALLSELSSGPAAQTAARARTGHQHTQHTGHMQRLVLRAHYKLGSAKSSLSISEHLWCDVSLTSLTSWRGKPLHQGSSR